MQIPLTWINELVEIKKTKLDNLVKKLTLGGFEVEEILELEIENQSQTILEISATANRSDSLSIQGISSEIAALLNQSLKIQQYSRKDSTWKQKIETQKSGFQTNQNYSIFISIIIDNLTNLTSPNWMKKKLLNSGIIPVNNLVDFQKYILLETGYPFEFYDFESLSNKLNSSKFDLSIIPAKNNQKFLASNNIEYNLDNSILTINANNIPISIAGIIESKDFLISKSTKTILVEGSIFKAAQIRQQSRKLGLRTDRSSRYEKSLQNVYLLESLHRLICLLKISNPNLICKFHSIKKTLEQQNKPIKLRYEIINEVLGPIYNSKNLSNIYVQPKKISEYLERLNFEFVYDKNNLIWIVEIPNSRAEDITREIDVIEEIGRLNGFNNFLTTLPKIKTIGNEDSTYLIRKKLTNCFMNLGFTELINYSLVDQKISADSRIKILNPISLDYSTLRSSLLPNLLETVQENLKQKNLPIEGFEYGHVFCKNNQKNFIEKEFIAGIFGGIKTKLIWSNKEIPVTWFEAKGKIEQLFKQLDLVTHWKKSSNKIINQLFHPYRSANIFLSTGSLLGIFGQISPILANKLNISPELYLFEFDVELIKNQVQLNRLRTYKSYSSYPKIVKDLSFIIQKKIAFETIKHSLYSNGTKFLSQIYLLDEYKGFSIPRDSVSLCLQLTFQSDKETLENKKIENIMNKLQLVLIKQFKAKIRE